MKKYIILTVLFLTTCVLYSQNPKEIEIIERDEDTQIPIKSCDDPEYGIIVVNTNIPDLNFKILNAERYLINQLFQPELNRYILCVEPLTQKNGLIDIYNIQVSSKNIITNSFSVRNIQSQEKRFYFISVKQSVQPQPNSVKYLALGVGNGVTNGASGVYAGLRFGSVVGLGIEAGVGLSDFDNKFTHWSLGAKLFPFNRHESMFLSGVCVSAHYGKVCVEKSYTSNSEDGSFEFFGAKQLNGFSFLLGYDNAIGIVHINTGLGISYSEQKKIMPAWNIGIGISITDIFKKK